MLLKRRARASTETHCHRSTNLGEMGQSDRIALVFSAVIECAFAGSKSEVESRKSDRI